MYPGCIQLDNNKSLGGFSFYMIYNMYYSTVQYIEGDFHHLYMGEMQCMVEAKLEASILPGCIECIDGQAPLDFALVY